MQRRESATVKHRMAAQVAVHDGRFKYMESADGSRELFDVVTDPGELTNLLDTHPEVADRLAAELNAWREAVPKFEPPADEDDGMDATTRRALEALGYVGGADEEDETSNEEDAP